MEERKVLVMYDNGCGIHMVMKLLLMAVLLIVPMVV
jgi:hypothetical protein